MKARTWLYLSALLAAGTALAPATAQDSFANLKAGDVKVGDVKVAEVAKADKLQVPFILWGGDVATFMANGGLDTSAASIFGKQGLNLHLTPGDDFVAQVRAFKEGKSPFLRGTMSMICQASEVLGADERTKPVVFLQMTWSNGDHLVVRPGLNTLVDLKGKRIALQKGGPHVGMLHDCLTTAGLTWNDIQVVWTDDVTGDKGPAELFRKDEKLNACFAITPDMEALTGGLGKTGTGAGGTIKDARVLVSTVDMNGSIADVYACRSDFFKANKPLVEKFTAGYLKACEDLAAMKPGKEKKGDPAAYKAVCKMAVQIYGQNEATKSAVTNEAEADGLISDAEFAFLTGNVFFFKAEKWGVNFKEKQKAGLDAALAVKSIAKATPFPDAGWDFANIQKLGGLQKPIPDDLTKLPERKIDPKKIKDLIGGDPKVVKPKTDTNTISSFVIQFEPEEETFDEKMYGPAFEKAVKDAAVFRNAVIAVRGHADLNQLLKDFVRGSMEKGYLKREGPEPDGPFKYFLKDGKELKLDDTAQVVKLINEWDFTDSSANPKRTLQALEDLSARRAETVQNTVMAYAKKYNLTIEKNQIQAVGIGAREPVEPLPRDKAAMAKNRRVEFRIYRLPTEATEGGGF